MAQSDWYRVLLVDISIDVKEFFLSSPHRYSEQLKALAQQVGLIHNLIRFPSRFIGLMVR